ncbi:hypothetical protein [Candidatus Uabimicrobium amorphum]|uniref:Uncharacterized protein n=1 Tax=Uabimicrobium amorphum TaxID=2596890 RepID=A0A5S9IQL2_UABAM|nr:hypothetical protein [Candidatus Uabimicrobium amorphum]BBM86269.1 hypothetical protein UABAM_04655 [Candidatus Uabimicrobium amorphum]
MNKKYFILLFLVISFLTAQEKKLYLDCNLETGKSLETGAVHRSLNSIYTTQNLGSTKTELIAKNRIILKPGFKSKRTKISVDKTNIERITIVGPDAFYENEQPQFDAYASFSETEPCLYKVTDKCLWKVTPSGHGKFENDPNVQMSNFFKTLSTDTRDLELNITANFAGTDITVQKSITVYREGIVDFTVKWDGKEIPEGYKSTKDLNLGAGGEYIYLCYKVGTPKDPNDRITGLFLVAGPEKVSVPPGYTFMGHDLNAASGGAYIYMAYKRGGYQPVQDIKVLIRHEDTPEGYEKIDLDLNWSVGGEYLYFAVKGGEEIAYRIVGEKSDYQEKSDWETFTSWVDEKGEHIGNFVKATFDIRRHLKVTNDYLGDRSKVLSKYIDNRFQTLDDGIRSELKNAGEYLDNRIRAVKNFDIENYDPQKEWENGMKFLRRRRQTLKKAIQVEFGRLEATLLKKLLNALMDERVSIPKDLQQDTDSQGKMLGGHIIYYVNGVLTTKTKAQISMRKLADSLQHPINVIYNQSQEDPKGYNTGNKFYALDFTETLSDLAWYNLNLFEKLTVSITDLDLRKAPDKIYVSNYCTRRVARLMYEKAKQSEPMTIISHSQGCAIVRNACFIMQILGYRPWVKKHLRWVAVGSPVNENLNHPRPPKDVRYYRLVDNDDPVVNFVGKSGPPSFDLDAHDFNETYLPRLKGIMKKLGMINTK